MSISSSCESNSDVSVGFSMTSSEMVIVRALLMTSHVHVTASSLCHAEVGRAVMPLVIQRLVACACNDNRLGELRMM